MTVSKYGMLYKEDHELDDEDIEAPPCMIMPSNTYKSYWDLFITLVLVYTCIVTPLRLAFVKGDETLGWTIQNFVVDAFFLIDIIINFMTAI